MKTWQKGLTINDQTFNFKELLAFSSDNIVSANTPPWEKEIYRFMITWLSDSDYIVQFSSGTTGKSKEIRLPKQSMMISARNTCRYFSLHKDNTALLCMPVDYIAGRMMIVRSLVGELNLYLTEPTSTPDISSSQPIDFCAMVPLQVMNLLNFRTDLNPIKNLIIGGAEISTALEKLLLDIPTTVYATYGMAETCSHVAFRKFNGPGRQKTYHALSGVTLAQDERGCLLLTATYLPGQIVTNDLVEFTGPGSFIWLGRYDNLINSGGIKIVPEEMEALIIEKTGLICAIIGLPDDRLGQRPVLVLEKKPELSEITIKRLVEKLFPHNKQPKEIAWVEEMPRNDSYKLDRRKLTEMVLKYQ